MAFEVGHGGKKMVLSSAGNKWRDFKSRLTKDYIIPFKDDTEKLKEPPSEYPFISRPVWATFVASRLSKEFEVTYHMFVLIKSYYSVGLFLILLAASA